MTTSANNSIDFPTILASSVHDIKNSLSTVRELIQHIAKKHHSSKTHDFVQLEFEANRMNNSLIQLLELYKIDSANFSLDIDEHSAADMLQEILAQQSRLLHLNKLKLSLNCAEDLFCYCDYTHICNALGSILNNAQRYTKSEIQISAYTEEDYMVFCMEDDGEGYPEQLLSINSTGQVPNSLLSGSTGLGLHFISTLAALHTANQNNGFIKIDNDSSLGGARFRLFLP